MSPDNRDIWKCRYWSAGSQLATVARCHVWPVTPGQVVVALAMVSCTCVCCLGAVRCVVEKDGA